MATLAHNDFDKGFRVRADPGSLTAYPFRRPIGAEPMVRRHVIFMGGMLMIAGGALVGGDAFAFKIYLYRARRDPDPERLLQ